jgi:hypothetical protein
MSEKGITTLTESLERLGFANLEQGIRLHIYLGAGSFSLVHKEEQNGDKLQSVLYFMRREEGNYSCTHYDATLRAKLFINLDLEVLELEKQMQAIAWDEVGGRAHNAVIAWPEIQAVLKRMDELSLVPGGVEVVGLLKLKFWTDTSLEVFIPNLSVLKNQYETTQRFHFFDDDGGISLNEAYRFLCHRWKERQMNKNKKIKVQESGSSVSSSPAKPNKKRGKGLRNKTES